MTQVQYIPALLPDRSPPAETQAFISQQVQQEAAQLVAAAQAAQAAAEAARDAALAAVPHIVVGAGRPDIPGTLDPDVASRAADATSGTVFRSTDGPQGAWEWMKQGTEWVVTQGDTGWVYRTLSWPWGAIASGSMRLRRIGAEVRADLTVNEWQSGSFGLQQPLPDPLPSGFGQTGQLQRPRLDLISIDNPADYVECVLYMGQFLTLIRRQGSSELPTGKKTWHGQSEPWHTANPWPTSLTI